MGQKVAEKSFPDHGFGKEGIQRHDGEDSRIRPEQPVTGAFREPTEFFPK